MLKLSENNYYSTEANRQYWSVSLFKAFNECEAAGLAMANGEYEREETDALLIGSYVDAYFAGGYDKFCRENAEKIFTKKGELYAKFQKANDMIDAVEAQPLMLEYLEGNKQVIMTGHFFDVDWKVKMDVYNGNRIVDFKTVRDFNPIYKEGFGKMSFIEAWGYDIQGAVYQKVVEQATGERLPFYIVAVTKEKVPDVDVIQIPQHILDTALKIVEAKIDRFDLVKTGEIPPERCGRCEWCKQTKILTVPSVYESGEASA